MTGLKVLANYYQGSLADITLLGDMDWMNSLTGRELDNLTKELRPMSIDRNMWTLSNNKCLKEVVDILKTCGFFVVSERSFNVLDEWMIAQGWECEDDKTEIEMYMHC